MSRFIKYILLFYLGYQLIQYFFWKKNKTTAHEPPVPPSPTATPSSVDGNEGEYIEYEEVKE